MCKTLLSYLTSNPILAKHNLSEQEISDLADYIIKIFPSSQVEEVIRMVEEEVIAINPTLSWNEILETVARKVVEFLHAEAATIRVTRSRDWQTCCFWVVSVHGDRTLERHCTVWEYVELGDTRRAWKRFRRLIYCRKVSESQQLLCDFARNHTLFYTNLGRGEPIDERLRAEGLSWLMEPERIIRDYHERGRDVLVHRAMKDFCAEELPFKRFAQNAAFYYTMLLGFFLYETFKEDVCAPAISLNAYPTTLRRKIIDIAVKVVRHAGRVILKVPEALWNHLHFDQLWRRSAHPPLFAWM